MRHQALRLLTGLVGVLAAAEASAADWYTGAPSRPSSEPPSMSIDLSLSGSTQEALHGAVIGTIAPFTHMQESGMRTRLSTLLGSYTYVATTPGVGRVSGSQVGGSFLVGYEWVMRTATVTLWGGFDAINTRLNKVDPLNETAGTVFGFKTGLDFHVNPTSFTMLSGTLSFSSANAAYFTRFKAGMAIAKGVFIGPELLMLGDNFYSQVRFGAHITGFSVGPVQFGLSAGLLNDAVRGAGGYATFDTRLTF